MLYHLACLLFLLLSAQPTDDGYPPLVQLPSYRSLLFTLPGWVAHPGSVTASLDQPERPDGGVQPCASHTVTLWYQGTTSTMNLSLWLNETCYIYLSQKQCIDTSLRLYFANVNVYVPQNLTNPATSLCTPVNTSSVSAFSLMLPQLQWSLRWTTAPEGTLCDLVLLDLQAVLDNLRACESQFLASLQPFGIVWAVPLSICLVFIVATAVALFVLWWLRPTTHTTHTSSTVSDPTGLYKQ
jgi:hypothetical protein